IETLVVVEVSASPAPVQVVPVSGAAGDPEVLIVRPDGSVALKLDWVSAKPLAFVKVIVSVEFPFGVTLAGANDALIVGAAMFTPIGVGQADALVPDAEAGAEL